MLSRFLLARVNKENICAFFSVREEGFVCLCVGHSFQSVYFEHKIFKEIAKTATYAIILHGSVANFRQINRS